jgi:hypothetical protein
MVTSHTAMGVDIPDFKFLSLVNERSPYPATGCWIIVRKIRLNFVIIIFYLERDRKGICLKGPKEEEKRDKKLTHVTIY